MQMFFDRLQEETSCVHVSVEPALEPTVTLVTEERTSTASTGTEQVVLWGTDASKCFSGGEGKVSANSTDI